MSRLDALMENRDRTRRELQGVLDPMVRHQLFELLKVLETEISKIQLRETQAHPNIRPPWEYVGGEFNARPWGRSQPPEENRRTGMNYSTAVFLVNDAIRAIKATYETEAENKNALRVMFKTLDKDIKVNDLVIVPTATRHGMTVVKVVEIDVDVDFDSGTHVDWVVSKIYKTDYEAVLKLEAEAIEQIKSAEKNKRKNELKAALIADNPELASSFNALSGTALPSPDAQ